MATARRVARAAPKCPCAAPWPGALAPRDRGRSAVRRVLARPLQHGRLDLPDRAARRGRCRATAGRSRAALADRARRGRAGAAARRRHVAMRPDRRRRARHRHSRSISTHCCRVRRASARRSVVQPGIVLDQLNAALRPHGLWYSRSTFRPRPQATIGGMAGNNSCGSRSIRYGNMVHNVIGDRAVVWRTATRALRSWVPGRSGSTTAGDRAIVRLVRSAMRAVAAPRGGRDRGALAARCCAAWRATTSTCIDPRGHNMAQLLVGSEGTLGFFTRVELKLAPLPAAQGAGRRATSRPSTQRWTRRSTSSSSGPAAVELVDRTMIDLPRDIPLFRPTWRPSSAATPDAILLVEFAGDELGRAASQTSRSLGELMGDLGLPARRRGRSTQLCSADIWEVRKAGLNIMMSMKGDGKPVSFIEDCAVPLEHLAEYTDRLTRVFESTRHPRHVVRARVGRLPACAARSSTCKDDGAAQDARHRRRGLRHGQRVQGHLLGRAWRRPRALRVDRADARRTRLVRASGRSRTASIRRACSIPARSSPAAHGRPQLFRFKPGYQRAAARDGARLVRLGRPRRCGRRCATTTATAASPTPA